MATTIEKRRKIRALEAKRDSLMETKGRSIAELAKIRAEIKHAKK